MDTILSDNVGGAEVRALASGTVVAVDGRWVGRVICSEIVAPYGLDDHGGARNGVTGRCGAPVVLGHRALACAGHAEIIDGYGSYVPEEG